MLDYWLRNATEKPTWRDVAKALKVIKLFQLAFDIESVYTTSKFLLMGNKINNVAQCHALTILCMRGEGYLLAMA